MTPPLRTSLLSRLVDQIVAALACLLVVAVLVPLASASTSRRPTCATVRGSLVKTTLGIAAVHAKASSKTTKAGGYRYLTCNYGGTVLITYITPATASGYQHVTTSLGMGVIATIVPGLGTAASMATGTRTNVTTSKGKQKFTVIQTQNLWVYAAGKALFEISVGNGSIKREIALAKRMLSVV
jgi:hypothetical protein